MVGARGSYREVLSGGQGGPQAQPIPSITAAAHAPPGNGLDFVRHALAAGFLDKGTVNPFHGDAGDRLDRGSFRNSEGLLVRGATLLTLDTEEQDTVAKEIPFLADHVVLVRLLEGVLSHTGPDSWWVSLGVIAAPGKVHFFQSVSQRYAYVRTDGRVTTDRILMHALHRFDKGAVLYQRWVKGFNPRIPRGITWPMWILLPELPLEYHKFARKVAEQVGRVLAEHHTGGFDSPPRFCVEVELNKGWIANVVGYSAAAGSASIPVHYEGLELNCLLCGHHQHRAAACTQFPSHRPTLPRPPPGPIPRHAVRAPSGSTGPIPPPTDAGLRSRATAPPSIHHPYRRQRRRRPTRHGFRNATRPGPDQDGFTPVIPRRRRPSLFDVRPTGGSSAPSRQWRPAPGYESSNNSGHGNRDDSLAPSPDARPLQAPLWPVPSAATPGPLLPTPAPPAPSRQRTGPLGWDVGPSAGPSVIGPLPHSGGVPPRPIHLPNLAPSDNIPPPNTQPAACRVAPPESSVPYLDPNDPHNQTDRSGNHYSNGKSRQTPLYKWNGWEKVYRTKKPYRGPPLPMDKDTSTDMDVDSVGNYDPQPGGNPAPASSSDIQILNLPPSPIPLSIDSEVIAAPVPEVPQQGARYSGSNQPASPPAQGSGQTVPLIPASAHQPSPRPPDGIPAQAEPGQDHSPDSTDRSPSTHPPLPPAAAVAPPAHPAVEHPLLSIGEEEFFEDAAQLLPATPTSPLMVRRALASFLSLDTDASPDITSPNPLPAIQPHGDALLPAQLADPLVDPPSATPQSLGSSLRSLRAAARLRPPSSSTLRSPPYDVWGFRRPDNTSGGDAHSPSVDP